MKPDEIEAICQEVLTNRSHPQPPMADPLPLRFRNPRRPTHPDHLTADELRQAVAVGQDGIGRRMDPAEVFGEDAVEEGLDGVEIWDVIDAKGALAYRVWVYGVDNGTVFRADTTAVVAGCSQGGVQSADGTLVSELVAARKRIPTTECPSWSCVRHFG